MIGLFMNQSSYENDIRALIMAFFPGEKIVLNGEEADHTVRVIFSRDNVKIDLEQDGKLLSSAEGAFDCSDYREGKNSLKRVLYDCLIQYKEKALPWGTLTGIRPTKIAMGLLNAGMSDEEMYDYFKKEYYLSDEKFRLCTRVAKNESRVLKDLDFEHTYSVYVGIPFCPTICAYCSFSSFPLSVWKKRVGDYLEALFKELDYLGQALAGREPLTLYMGGGTPTSLTASQMDRLLGKLGEIFDF